MIAWIVGAAVTVVGIIIVAHNFAEAVEWAVQRVPLLKSKLRRDTEVPKPWLLVRGIAPALSGGALISDGKHRETSLSIYLQIINRHEHNGVSLSFSFSDAAFPGKQLWPAQELDLIVRKVPKLGKPYNHLFPPVAVAAQKEVFGSIFFFYPGPPKTMPLRTLTIKDSIHGGEFTVDLPEPFLEQARAIDWYPA
jgi:hypothetical protein